MLKGLIQQAACCCLLLVHGSWAQTSNKERTDSGGVDLQAIDRSADPCQNFYQYACGAWLKANPIPADESRWSRFDQLNERNEATLRQILENSEANQGSSKIDGEIGRFYGACM